MEQFRAFLEVLKKYHFWVLCGLIVLFSFGSWFLATGDETKRFADRTKQIKAKLDLANAIANNHEHPSAPYIQKIREIESGPLTTQVANASDHLYNEQQRDNHLPRVFPGEAEQKGFEAAFYDIWRPMEEIEKLPPNQLQEFYRSRYRNHIEEAHIPELFRLIERRQASGTADDPAGGDQGRGGGIRRGMGIGGGDAGALSKSTSGIVDWIDSEQKIKALLERFKSGTPSTLDIMLTQEDLWIYETLLKVIRNTNNVGPDKDHYQKPANHKVARIKQILAMDIGRDAVQSWSNSEKALFTLPNESSGGGTDGGRGGSSPPPPPPTMTGRGVGGTSQGPAVSPLAGRYVDDKGKPLTDPTEQPCNREFRMMPINLKVVIEQKEIPRLLAECANSAMRIDVRSVRILAQEPPPVDLSAPDAAASGGETGTQPPALSRSFGMGRGGMGGGGGGGDSAGSKTEWVYNEESADQVYQPIPVEVHGIIYIYNPPRIAKAGEATAENGGSAQPPPGGPPPSAGLPGTGASAAAGAAAPAATPSRGAPAGAAAPVPIIPPASTPATGGRR